MYDVEGARTTYYVPPTGFDPHYARKSELRRYGFGGSADHKQAGRPSRVYLGPNSARQVPDGETLHFLKPPPVIYVLPGSSSGGAESPDVKRVDSKKWSGFVDTGRTDFYEVQSSWTEPALGKTTCKNHSVVFWVGLGGWNGVKQLAQDGTARDAPGLGQNQGWSEVLPAQPTVVPQKITAPVGSSFYANTTYVGDSRFTFTMEGDPSGNRISFGVQADGYNGSTAEVIVERPTIGGALSTLAHFKPITFRASGVATHEEGIHWLLWYPRDRVTMHNFNDGRDLDSVGAIRKSGAFTVTHKNCR